ncbi:glycosyltransferase family 4 protein [Variovorax sp. RA8]|uniref:glycosyltransferase family 4 protein n=1 Tax=Variovorax sp. (strain JCM 16519 / RA8) TaxID=662548 RepID=UPI000AA0B0BD|nr:glycosyltransferase family 4 protein [Variovorax sp. RA8]VTU37493.1 putative glycosyl transferase [Variovorax sp. RA8]
MKHVWIFNHYATEPGSSGGTRHFELACLLNAHGWQASLIAASFDAHNSRGRLVEGEQARLEVIDGVPFLWIRTPDYQGNGLGRMRNMLAYAWRVLPASTLSVLPRPDVVVGSSVHLLAAWAAAIWARRCKVPFVFEVRDLWPQTLVDMGRLREGSAMVRLLRKLELWLYRRADRIVVLLPFASEYIAPMGIAEEKIVWIPNGVNASRFSSLQRSVHPPSAPFTLMYLGAHGQANGLEGVLQAMKQVQEANCAPRVLLRLIGEGPQKAALQAKALEMRLDNVRFEPAVPKAEIPAVAAQADAFVIAVLDLPGLYRYGISMNKLFDYLAAARPVIIASDAANNPVRDAKAGLAVSAGEPGELADAILKLAAMSPEERWRMGQSGRAYVEQNHDFSSLAARLGGLLDEVCMPRGRLGTVTT